MTDPWVCMEGMRWVWVKIDFSVPTAIPIPISVKPIPMMEGIFLSIF